MANLRVVTVPSTIDPQLALTKNDTIEYIFSSYIPSHSVQHKTIVFSRSVAVASEETIADSDGLSVWGSALIERLELAGITGYTIRRYNDLKDHYIIKHPGDTGWEYTGIKCDCEDWVDRHIRTERKLKEQQTEEWLAGIKKELKELKNEGVGSFTIARHGISKDPHFLIRSASERNYWFLGNKAEIEDWLNKLDRPESPPKAKAPKAKTTPKPKPKPIATPTTPTIAVTPTTPTIAVTPTTPTIAASTSDSWMDETRVKLAASGYTIAIDKAVTGDPRYVISDSTGKNVCTGRAAECERWMKIKLKVKPIAVDPVKVDPVKVDPVKVEPIAAVKIEPDMVDPVAVDPVTDDPVTDDRLSIIERLERLINA
jgi:hypothetical protein